MTTRQNLPRYRIVEEYLRSGIKVGTFPVGDLLPTEQELCRRFDISRSTVRQALQNLQSDGLIERNRAIGSRVVAALPQKAFSAGWSSVEDLLQHTQAVHLNVQSVREVTLDERLAERTGFEPRRGLVQVIGRRELEQENGLPLCRVEIYFDALYNGIVPRIAGAGVPVAELIDEAYGVRIATIRQEITADVLDTEEAESLQAAPGSAALVIRRWYADQAGKTFQMTLSRYPSDRFAYVVEFGRASPNG